MKFPKLTITQIIGLVAIVVFGTQLVLILVKPKRDPMMLPSGINLRDIPTVKVPEPTLPPLDMPSIAPPAPLDLSTSAPAPSPTPKPVMSEAQKMSAGSQETKDALYCAGVVRHLMKKDDKLKTLTSLQIGLQGDGQIALITEGVDDEGDQVSEAQMAKAQADAEAGTTRLTLDQCKAIRDTNARKPVR